MADTLGFASGQALPRATLGRRGITAVDVIAFVLVAGVLLFTGYPLLTMIVTAFSGEHGFDLSVWSETFAGRGLAEATRNTVIVLVACVTLSVPIATFFAWLNERTDAHMGALSTFLPIVPLLLPPTALAIGWLFLGDPNAGFIAGLTRWALAPLGVPRSAITFGIYSWPGLIFVYLLFLVPHAYIIIAAGFRSLDPSLEEAARMSGKSRLQCLFGVSIPAIKPAIGSAALLTAIATVELYSIPAIVATPAQILVLPTYIQRLLHGQFPPATNQAVVLGLLMALAIGAVWLVQRRVAVHSQYARIGGMGVRANRISMGRMRTPARIVMFAYLAATSVLPILALLVVSLQRYWTPIVDWKNLSIAKFVDAVVQPQSRDAIVNSTILGVAAGTIAVLIAGTLAIYAADAGGRRERWIGLATKLPATMSTLVLAIGMLVAFGGPPFRLGGTLAILLICHVISRLPTASIAAESSVAQIGSQLVEASRVNGSSKARTFRRILLPLTAPGLAAGWALIFAVIVGDLTAAAMLAGPSNTVIGYRIQNIYDFGTYSDLAALGVVIAVVSGIAVGLVLRFVRPRYSGG
ncbi:MAG TPA: iron ABC transporter permease [Devosiaceae bacterium]|jgi:iron(III) transport system permease protein